MDIAFWVNDIIRIMVIPAIVLMIVQIILMIKVSNKFIKLIPIYIVLGMLIAIFVPGIFQISWYTENMPILLLSLTSPIYVFLSVPWIVVMLHRIFSKKKIETPISHMMTMIFN